MLKELFEDKSSIYAGNIPEQNDIGYWVNEYALRIFSILERSDQALVPKDCEYFAKRLLRHLSERGVSDFQNIEFYNDQKELQILQNEKLIVPFFNTSENLPQGEENLNDKLIFKTRTQELGIQTPEFRLCYSPTELTEAFHHITQNGYSQAIIKFRFGFAGFGNFIVKDFQGILEILSRSNFLLEMEKSGIIIEGCLDIEKYDAVNVNYFSDTTKGTLKKLGHSRQVLDYLKESHTERLAYLGSTGYTMNPEDENHIEETVQKLIQPFHVQGFMGVDVLVDPEKKHPSEFIETNIRMNFSLVPISLAEKYDLHDQNWIFTTLHLYEYARFNDLLKHIKKYGLLFDIQKKQGILITNFFYKQGPSVDVFIVGKYKEDVQKMTNIIQDFVFHPQTRGYEPFFKSEN